LWHSITYLLGQNQANVIVVSVCKLDAYILMLLGAIHITVDKMVGGKRLNKIRITNIIYTLLVDSHHKLKTCLLAKCSATMEQQVF